MADNPFFIPLKSNSSTSQARLGQLRIRDFTINTPIFMPVATQGALKGYDHGFLDRIGYQLLLANTYHLYLRPGLEILESFDGLRSFANLNAALLTDSGGFQAFSLSPLVRFFPEGIEFRSHHDGSKHLFTPESVLEAQRIIGSDIRMLLDHVVAYGADKKDFILGVQRTTDWARRSLTAILHEREAGKQPLNGGAGHAFPILQGGFDIHLRQQAAEELCALDFPGFAVGGLSVGEERPIFQDMAYLTAGLLPADKPRYIMGVGAIPDLLTSMDAGFDMFDCVFPTRNARNGQFLTSLGALNIRNSRFKTQQTPIDPDCACSVCQRFSAAYLHHIFHVKEILAAMAATEHNLFFINRFIGEARQAIEQGNYASFQQYWLERYPAERGKRGHKIMNVEL